MARLHPSLRRIARFADGGRVFHALLRDGGLVCEIAGDPFAEAPSLGPERTPQGLTWLPPCEPSKIVGVGRNYREHAAELGHDVPAEPLLFLKPPSAILPPQGTIRLPAASARVDYEGELGIVIGRTACSVSEADAPGHVLGYTCVNDVTARDLQKRDVQFTRAKGFDTFCPIGPCVAIGLDPTALVLETFVNGSLRQRAHVAQMIVPPFRLVSYISHIMTLVPGDVIATGTPEGVGPLAAGDEVVVAIEGIGRLANQVQVERRPGD